MKITLPATQLSLTKNEKAILLFIQSAVTNSSLKNIKQLKKDIESHDCQPYLIRVIPEFSKGYRYIVTTYRNHHYQHSLSLYVDTANNLKQAIDLDRKDMDPVATEMLQLIETQFSKNHNSTNLKCEV